jgi:hypothetical protein
MRGRDLMMTALLGQSALGRSVMAKHQHDSHGDDAERRQ